jgi:hypothetical protein
VYEILKLYLLPADGSPLPFHYKIVMGATGGKKLEGLISPFNILFLPLVDTIDTRLNHLRGMHLRDMIISCFLSLIHIQDS